KTVYKSASAHAQLIATTPVAARESYDLFHHVDVGPPRFLGCHEEFGVAGEPWIRIRLDDVHFAFFRKAHVNAPVVAKLKRLISIQRDLLKTRNDLLVQVLGRRRLGHLVGLSILL